MRLAFELIFRGWWFFGASFGFFEFCQIDFARQIQQDITEFDRTGWVKDRPFVFGNRNQHTRISGGNFLRNIVFGNLIINIMITMR